MKEKLQQPTRHPPYPYMQIIAKNCHKAMDTYFWLWEHRDKKSRVELPFDEMMELTLKSRKTFTHDCIALAREGIVNVSFADDRIGVELVGWDD